MAARMVVLRRSERSDDGSKPADVWVRVGAATVDVDVPGDWDMARLERAQSLAVEAMAAQGGVFTAIPFEFWRLFEAEAQITVRPVPVAPLGGLAVDLHAEAGTDEEEILPTADDPDLEGLTQGPRLP
jgi:hypothetical protein